MGLWTVMGLALLAGAAIPVGGALALWFEKRPGRVGERTRHGIIAFGGGVLVAAVALVLVPHGGRLLDAGPAVLALAVGGLAFYAVDRILASSGGSRAQLLAMLTDFVPEALALGALLATGEPAGALLALLIALQNLPEGFNAFDEARLRTGSGAGRILGAFAGLALLGPLMAWFGFSFLRGDSVLLGALMLFAAGGILYLTFQDIAPETHVAASGLPALGAVAGFALGLAGQLLLG